MKIKRYSLLVLLAFWQYYTLLMVMGVVVEVQQLVTGSDGFYLPGLLGSVFSVIVMIALLIVCRRVFSSN